jgi:hypothetical protein
MACEECARARANPDHHRVYDPACLWCGARYVKQLRQYYPGKTDLAEKRKAAMDVWERNGHDRVQLRELATAAALPLEPRGKGAGNG